MWKITHLSSWFGALILVATFILSESAPQQAAGAALGIGFAVIPYCIARAQSEVKAEEIEKIKREKAEREK